MNELQVMNCNASVKPIAFHFTWLGMVFVGHSVREMCLCSMGLKCGSDSLPCAVQTLSVIWKRFEKIVVLQDGFECHVVVISCFHSTEWHGLFTYGWAADVPFTWVSLLARVDRLLFETTAEGQSCKKNSQLWKANRHIFEISMVQLKSSFEASSLLNTSWFAGHRDLKPENFLLLDCSSCDAVCTVFGVIFFHWDSIPGSFCQFAWWKGDCPD